MKRITAESWTLILMLATILIALALFVFNFPSSAGWSRGRPAPSTEGRFDGMGAVFERPAD